MIGGRRKKNKKPPAKKKWELSDSSEAEDEGPDDMACKKCKSESDVFCLNCKAYFCVDCFNATHAGIEGGEEEAAERPSKRQATGDEEPKTKEEEKAAGSVHKFRALVGLEDYRLDTIRYGWEQARPEPQSVVCERNKKQEAESAAARGRAAEQKRELEAAKALEDKAAMETAMAAALEAKKKRDAEYEITQQEAEMRNRRDLAKGIVPKSLKQSRGRF